MRRTLVSLPNLVLTLCLALPLGLFPSVGSSQTRPFPNQAIKIIVSGGPGGPTDLMARLIASYFLNTLGAPTIVENLAGAGGRIGARSAAMARRDGYTLLLGNTAILATIPAVSKTAGYDPVNGFVPVAKIMSSFQVLVVPTQFPAKTVAELVAYAKQNPGKLNGAAAGVGNITHLSLELFKLKTGIDYVPIFYKSATGAMQGLIAGEAHFAIDNISVVRPLIDGGQLRALAVTSEQRQPDMPDVPTMAEAGVQDLVITSFFGIVAPAGTPPAIVNYLNKNINAALQSPNVSSYLMTLGVTPSAATPEDFATLIALEYRKWQGIANSANIQVD